MRSDGNHLRSRSESSLRPQTVSWITSRLCSSGELRLCGLRLQHLDWSVKGSNGPFFPVLCGLNGKHAATDLMTTIEPKVPDAVASMNVRFKKLTATQRTLWTFGAMVFARVRRTASASFDGGCFTTLLDKEKREFCK